MARAASMCHEQLLLPVDAKTCMNYSTIAQHGVSTSPHDAETL